MRFQTNGLVPDVSLRLFEDERIKWIITKLQATHTHTHTRAALLNSLFAVQSSRTASIVKFIRIAEFGNVHQRRPPRYILLSSLLTDNMLFLLYKRETAGFFPVVETHYADGTRTGSSRPGVASSAGLSQTRAWRCLREASVAHPPRSSCRATVESECHSFHRSSGFADVFLCFQMTRRR